MLERGRAGTRCGERETRYGPSFYCAGWRKVQGLGVQLNALRLFNIWRPDHRKLRQSNQFDRPVGSLTLLRQAGRACDWLWRGQAEAFDVP